MFGTIEVGDVYGKVSLLSEASFDFLERVLILLSENWPSLDEMFILIIYYLYLITSFSGGRFYIVNTRDNERHRPSSGDGKNIDFHKAIDNSLADYNDGFEKRFFQRKYQKFKNFIKSNPKLWKDANEITKKSLINFLQFQYRRNSMLQMKKKDDGVVWIKLYIQPSPFIQHVESYHRFQCFCDKVWDTLSWTTGSLE